MQARKNFLLLTAECVMQEYEDLCKRLKELSILEGVNGLLMWDEMVRTPGQAFRHA